jgi:hypothetical protein
MPSYFNYTKFNKISVIHKAEKNLTVMKIYNELGFIKLKNPQERYGTLHEGIGSLVKERFGTL